MNHIKLSSYLLKRADIAPRVWGQIPTETSTWAQPSVAAGHPTWQPQMGHIPAEHMDRYQLPWNEVAQEGRIPHPAGALLDTADDLVKHVEPGVQAQVRALNAAGNQTYMSNHAGPGARGTWYRTPDNQRMFAPLEDARTAQKITVRAQPPAPAAPLEDARTAQKITVRAQPPAPAAPMVPPAPRQWGVVPDAPPAPRQWGAVPSTPPAPTSIWQKGVGQIAKDMIPASVQEAGAAFGQAVSPVTRPLGSVLAPVARFAGKALPPIGAALTGKDFYDTETNPSGTADQFNKDWSASGRAGQTMMTLGSPIRTIHTLQSNMADANPPQYTPTGEPSPGWTPGKQDTNPTPATHTTSALERASQQAQSFIQSKPPAPSTPAAPATPPVTPPPSSSLATALMGKTSHIKLSSYLLQRSQ